MAEYVSCQEALPDSMPWIKGCNFAQKSDLRSYETEGISAYLGILLMTLAFQKVVFSAASGLKTSQMKTALY